MLVAVAAGGDAEADSGADAAAAEASGHVARRTASSPGARVVSPDHHANTRAAGRHRRTGQRRVHQIRSVYSQVACRDQGPVSKRLLRQIVDKASFT